MHSFNVHEFEFADKLEFVDECIINVNVIVTAANAGKMIQF